MDKVYNFLFKELKFNKDEPVVAAISGGPDSMALLYLLIELRKTTGIHIICAHVNHNLREESAEEKDFLEAYCKSNEVTFEFMKIEEYSDDNFHNQARTIRYKFFESVVKKYKSNYLMTAHHGDDLMETILMRIVRGSTLRGYSGFSKMINNEGYNIVRPLVFITKDQILKYAEEKNIEYRIDKSNTKDKYTRNRYRKYVLPFLKQEDPKVNEKFLKYSETLLMYNDYIESIMKKSFDKVFDGQTLLISEYQKLDKIIQIKTINYIFECVYDDDLMLVNDSHTKMVIDMINSEKPNSKIYLPNNLLARKEYDKILFVEENNIEDYCIEITNVKNTINIPNGRNINSIEEIELDDNNICRLDIKDITFPLYIRNRKNGDKIQIKGMSGTKKIKDIFINEKIAQEDRNNWPILVDANDVILWIPGLKKSKYNQPKNKKCDIIFKYD